MGGWRTILMLAGLMVAGPVTGGEAGANGIGLVWIMLMVAAVGLLVLLATAYLAWTRYQQIRRAARSEPPGALPLPQAIALLNENEGYRGQAHPALIMQLARQGYLRLKPRKGGFFREATVHVGKGDADPAELPDALQQLVATLAGRDLKKSMKKDLKTWAEKHGAALRRPLVVSGLVQEREGHRGRMWKRAGLSGLLALITAVPLLLPDSPDWRFWLLAGVGGPLLLLAIVFAVMAEYPWRMTEAGEEQKLALKGWFHQLKRDIDPHRNGLPSALSRFGEHLEWVMLVDPDGQYVAQLERALKKAKAKDRQAMRDLLPGHAIDVPLSEKDRKRYGEQAARALAVLKAMRETQSAAVAVVAVTAGGAAGASSGGGC